MELKFPASWKKAALRYKYIILAIAVGAVILLLPTGDSNVPDSAAQMTGFGTDELWLCEESLEAILSQIDRVGRVKVMLGVRDSKRTVLAYDTRMSDGQSQYDTVIVSRGSGLQQPVVLQETGPTYQGALVVCTGGDDPQVKLRVIGAVRALTGLSTDKICVCKAK